MKLAFYNVFRNKRRTFITLLSIVSASIAMIVFGGFISYTFEALRETTIHTELGHFQLATSGYFDKGAGIELKNILQNPAEVEEKVREVPHIKALTRRLSGSGLVSTGNITLIGNLVGVEPENEEDFSYSEILVEGTPLEVGKTDECLLGEGLARGLKAKTGDTVTILSTTFEGVINASECRVSGIVRTGAKAYDAVYVKTHLHELQRLLDTKGVEKLLVLLESTSYVPEIKTELLKRIENMPVDLREWSDLAEFYAGVVNLYTSIFRVAAAVLAIVVLLSIANTMSMCVFERFREIGTLRAMGETRTGIMRLFIAEGFIIGVLGGIVGIAAGIAAAHLINASGGIEMAPPPGRSSGYTAYITPTYLYYVWSFGIAVFASVGASIYPAYKASRLDIVKALQHI